jgi:hypothetical protein
MVVLLGFTALAVDGGNLYNQRRIAQNAADAAVLTGALFLAERTPQSAESGLLTAMIKVAENNGVPDSDGVAGNAINTNLTAYYVDAKGDRLPDPNQVGSAGLLPSAARGVEVITHINFNAFLAGFVGRPSLDAQSGAVAVYQPPLACGGYAVFADRTDGNPNTMHFSGSSSTVIGGGLHSNSGIHLGGFTTDVGPVEYDVNDQANLSNYVGPALTSVPHFPMPKLYKLADFQPPSGTYWTQACAAGKCFQSTHLTQIQSDGLYFVNGDVDVGNATTSQAVTIVATGPIKISVRPNVSFRPYIAGLFLFSTQTAPGQPAIDLGGHSPSDNPRGYDGILFAPNGVIKMSSQNTHEVRGAVFGWEVDFSGSVNIINFHPEYCPPARAKIFVIK